ncbi:MAG TPA: hypothetical protein VF265_00480 [Nevskiaceae bacterium]
METLFRLLLQRPAVPRDETLPPLRLAYGSHFDAAAKQAAASRAPRAQLAAFRQAAQVFVASAEFVGTPTTLKIAPQLAGLTRALDGLEASAVLDNARVAEVTHRAFGVPIPTLVQDPAVTSAVTRLMDSILSIKLLASEQTRPLALLVQQLRDLKVILKAATDQTFPDSGRTLRRYRRRPLLLPDHIDRHSGLSTREWRQAQEQLQREARTTAAARAAEAVERYRQLKTAFEELTSLDASHLQTTPQRPAPDATATPEAGTAPTAETVATTARLLQQAQRTQVILKHAQTLIAEGTRNEAAVVKLQAEVEAALAEAGKLAAAADTGAEMGDSARAAALIPPADDARGLRLKVTAAKVLSPSTRELLDQRKLAVDARPLDQLALDIHAGMRALATELDALYQPPPQVAMRRIGTTLVATSVAAPPTWPLMLTNDADATAPPERARPLLPANALAPLQAPPMADLLIVKQRLVRYEAADVSHIENILKSERKEREHTRRRETEELIFREAETTTSEERDLESTARYEMTNATSETLAEDSTLAAGVSVSGSYGPMVEFSASAEGSTSRSKTAATNVATSFSRDVTERSAKKITQRVLERTSLRTTTEEIERSLHGFDNTTGSGHVSGVYQWVNKVYRAQMYNYGRRAMYDFMVPEPAAFLISVQENDHAGMVRLAKPRAFGLQPSQITEANYQFWGHEYGATDVEPPPEEYRTKAVAFDSGTKNANEDSKNRVNYTHSAEIQIDDGYRAIASFATCARIPWSVNDASANVAVQIGQRAFLFWPGEGFMSLALDGESGSIPCAISSNRLTSFTLALEIKCQRTPRALQKWQHETHAKLTQAYRARLNEYEERLAEIEMRAGSSVQGHNPALNLQLMRDELKKHCLSILTQQHFDAFGAIENFTESGLRQVNLQQAALEAPYVRFFEQAFEWEHTTWKTYPYFWGGKDRWRDRVRYEDDDPAFNQFLKAGYARVVVPARPGFEYAIEHFLQFGELWNGGPLPAIGDDLYLPIAEEIAEELDRPSDEVTPQGEAWEVVVPTTLVHLRADDQLPRWDPETGEAIED